MLNAVITRLKQTTQRK